MILGAYRAAFSGLPRSIWIISAAALVNRAGTMVLPFLSLYVTAELGATAVEAGQVLTVFGIGSLVGSWVGGWASDRVGSVRVQVITLVAGGACFLTVGWMRTLPTLTAAVLVASIVSEAFRPAVMASIVDHCPTEVRARAFAALRLAVNAGMAIGPAVGGLLALRSYSLLFVGEAVTCWAAAAVLAVFVGPPSTVAATDGGEGARGRSPWRDLPFLALLLLTMMLGITFFQLWTTYPLFMKAHYGLSAARIGALFSINAALIVAFEMVLIKAVETLDPMRVAAVGALLVAGGLAILPLGSGLALAVLSMVVVSVGEMLSLPMLNAAVAVRAGPGAAGAYMGLYAVAYSAAFIAAPVLGAAVYEHLGGTVLWAATGLVGVVVTVGLLALARPLGRGVRAG